MKMRSWLFVPGDSEKKLGKAATCGADVVIVDLEDAVAQNAKAQARKLAVQWLEAHRHQVLSGAGVQRWVRINPLDGHLWRDDLAGIIAGHANGIVVPKATGPEQLRMLAAELYEHEQRNGVQPNSTRIMPLVSETAKAAMGIAHYAEDTMPRLSALTWGAEDLSAAIGATRKRDEHGEWTDLFRMVRAQVLLTAHARGVAAIDTVYSDFSDLAGLERAAKASHADGFAGMLAIHPRQVPVINAAFSPSEAEIAKAQAIVDLFSANPGRGALSLDGQMIDRPHLEQAQRLLERAP